MTVSEQSDEAVVGLRCEGAACNRFQRNRHRSFIIVTAALRLEPGPDMHMSLQEPGWDAKITVVFPRDGRGIAKGHPV